MNESGLIPVLKDRLSKFSFNIVDEDLTPHNTSYLRYNSVNKNWISFPQERVRVIANAIETYIFPTDYTVNATDGYITFNVARQPTNIIRVDYGFFPFTDAQLLTIIQAAVKQIRVLIYHTIDSDDIATNYQEAILKRCYTVAIREMQFPTIKYFAISVGGRSMDKSNQLVLMNAMIESNEKDLLQDINAIRYFDKTNIIT